MSVHSKMCLLEIKLFSNFRATCAKHHPGYCKYLVLCVCKHLQQQQKQKKLSQLLIFPDHLCGCNSPYILTIVDDAPRSDATQKKNFFFQDAYQEASNVWYEKMKKKLHASSHFRLHNVVTRCFSILKINEVEKI